MHTSLNPDSIRSAIETLLSNPPLVTRSRQGCRQRVASVEFNLTSTAFGPRTRAVGLLSFGQSHRATSSAAELHQVLFQQPLADLTVATSVPAQVARQGLITRLAAQAA